MPANTDFNVSPYYDDYNPKKDYYKVLFQPGVAVQARELNQLQSILQNQIEKFGDNIFKRGTIIEGCNITRHEILPYVKIKDLETDGAPVAVSTYDNLTVRNSSNVQARIVKTVAGFESRSPDLNTLYVTYNGSGTDGNTATFAAGDTLDIFDTTYPIFKMRVVDGSSKFSNADSVVVMSAIAVTNSTGGNTFPAGAFVAGHVIQNGVANATIVEANATANAEVLILKVKPLASDLLAANTIKWRFGAGDTIRNATTANVANVAAIVGGGAEASITTDTLGKVTALTVTSGGSGYYVPPYVTIKIETTSSITTAEITQLDVTGLNYLTTITVANSAVSSIGTGYGVTVDEGTIYQKGFFSRVSTQLEVVNKYSNTGFSKSVGFLTQEAIINSNQDTTLLDNATGTYNYTAPGADRLKLTPVLYVLDKADADANTEFLPIIEFADGRPYKQNLSTVYNVIGAEMAKRTYEESGNYVLDQFMVATKDSSTFTDTPSVFKVAVDPGIAYINGYRVETIDNYIANVAKGVDTVSKTDAAIRLGYGNYIRVKELGGVFEFNKGASIDLYDTAKTYISTAAGAAITAPGGTKIGTARVRSIINESASSEPGSKDASYRLYLFDITMTSGKNFSSVRSVYHNGTNKGVADLILNSANVAELLDTRDSSLLFKTVDAMKYANNMTYTYRTINQGEEANSTGYIVLNLGAGETFPYTGELNTSEKRDFVIIPLADYEGQTNATGTITCNTTSPIVNGAGGMDFTTSFNIGDYVKFGNTTSTTYGQVSQISGASSMVLTSNASTTYTAGATMKVAFPKNVPISLTNDATKWANVESGNSQVLTIFLGNTVANSTGSSSSANVVIAYNATRTNVSSAAKTVQRNIYTRIIAANNTSSVNGPWPLGVSDTFRLRNVYIANGASRDITFDVSTNITNSGTANAFITVANNVFANGDSLVYSNTAGAGVLGGISNNQTVYVVYANSSGFSLASTRGGANLTLTSNTSSTHKFTGQPLYFGPNTYGVTDVTNDFYLEMNHNPDYMDTSYLSRKPRRAVLNTTDVLLVKYDAFTGAAGVKTISSYPVSDSETFAALSASANVHTMEIPEFLGTSGKYYDLRDQFDFRPRSNNTIGFVTDVTSVAAGANALSIINPAEPSDANRFASAEQYFPAPDTTLTANIQYYQGRTDRVLINSEGDFIVRAGKPGFMNEVPSEPKNSMTLQILRIPAYPSLPQSLSSDIVNITDTRVAYSRRKSLYSVSATMSAAERSAIQIKNYKMADIASLEKRIKDLEYYVSFTLAEAIASARFIPSSIDALLDRFRFGFFVDPFTDYNYSDIGNPEFWATVRDNQLGPKLTELNLEFKDDSGSTGVITLPFTEFNVITQGDATNGPITTVTDEPSPTTGDVTVTTVTQSTSTVTQSQRSTARDDNGTVYEEFYYTMSSLVGPVEFYLNTRDKWNALEVFQSTSASGPWTTTITSASAQAITNADIASKGLYNLNGEQIEHPGTLDRKGSGPVGNWLEDQYKVLWSHDPTNGQYYKLRVYKGGHHGGQGNRGTFTYKLFYPTDAVTTQTTTTTNPNRFVFNGTVYNVNPAEFTLSSSFNLLNIGYGVIGGYEQEPFAFVADSQRFLISVSGLKPSTYHQFIFNSEDATSKCTQVRNTTTNTNGILSDVNGVVTFEFFYDAGINEATSDMQQQNRLAAALAGVKTFTLQSYDGTSKATGSINMKYYASIWEQIAAETASVNNTFNVTPSITTTSTSTTTGAVVTTTPVTQIVNDAIENNNVNFRDIAGTRMAWK